MKKDALDRTQRHELLRRALGLKHKVKVHASMKQPDTHEELASNYLALWEFEDEIAAIEEIMAEQRRIIVAEKKAKLLADALKASGSGTSGTKSRPHSDQ